MGDLIDDGSRPTPVRLTLIPFFLLCIGDDACMHSAALFSCLRLLVIGFVITFTGVTEVMRLGTWSEPQSGFEKRVVPLFSILDYPSRCGLGDGNIWRRRFDVYVRTSKLQI